jgi:hypothetical protein
LHVTHRTVVTFERKFTLRRRLFGLFDNGNLRAQSGVVAYASLWAWAQQNGHTVAAAWTAKPFKFADVDATFFRLEAQKQFTYEANRTIFENPRTGARWSGDLVVRGAWKRAVSAAGVRYRRPYQTRHTYASMMLTAGESPMWVAQQMGHKDWTMIARVYGRWIKDAMPLAGAKAVKMFAATS